MCIRDRGKFLEDHDKKEWATMIYEFIDIVNGAERGSDSDYDYSEDEGDAVSEDDLEVIVDEKGFSSLT